MNDVIDICKIEGSITIDNEEIIDKNLDVVRASRENWNGFSKT